MDGGSLSSKAALSADVRGRSRGVRTRCRARSVQRRSPPPVRLGAPRCCSGTRRRSIPTSAALDPNAGFRVWELGRFYHQRGQLRDAVAGYYSARRSARPRVLLATSFVRFEHGRHSTRASDPGAHSWLSPAPSRQGNCRLTAFILAGVGVTTGARQALPELTATTGGSAGRRASARLGFRSRRPDGRGV